MVLATTVVRPTAIHEPVAIGLMFGLGTAVALCALGVLVASMMQHMPTPSDDQHAEELKWAMRFGQDLADAFRTAPTRHPGGR